MKLDVSVARHTATTMPNGGVVCKLKSRSEMRGFDVEQHFGQVQFKTRGVSINLTNHSDLNLPSTTCDAGNSGRSFGSRYRPFCQGQASKLKEFSTTSK